jgi:ribosomal protein S18 acetylase RimI-like enzyme
MAPDLPNTSILTGGPELLDRIAPLWQELRSHHASISPTWRHSLLASDFQARKADLLQKSATGLLVLLATTGDEVVAYCVSSITHDNTGEIDSLYVRQTHRRRGIAHRLMTDSMAWLQRNNAKSIVVEVLSGNDEAVHLYEKFGFHPRVTRLRYVP